MPEESSETPPEILAIESVATTQIFHVEKVTLRFKNGEIRDFERLKVWDPGIVMIIPVNDNNEILLIREYGAGINGYSLSLPKGKVEPGEDLLAAANRELQEEVGFKASNLSYLKALSAAPSYAATQTHMVLARGLTPARLPADEPEPIEVVPWKLSNLPALLVREDFHEARAFAALYLAQIAIEGKGVA